MAELIVSDIKRLELESNGTLLEEKDNTTLYVSAFDYNGLPFDLD